MVKIDNIKKQLISALRRTGAKQGEYHKCVPTLQGKLSKEEMDIVQEFLSYISFRKQVISERTLDTQWAEWVKWKSPIDAPLIEYASSWKKLDISQKRELVGKIKNVLEGNRRGSY